MAVVGLRDVAENLMVCQGRSPIFLGASLDFFFLLIYQLCNYQVFWQSLRDNESLGRKGEGEAY